MAEACNSGPWEDGAERLPSLTSACFTQKVQGQPGLNSEILSQNKKKIKDKNKNKNKFLDQCSHEKSRKRNTAGEGRGIHE